GDSRAYLLRGHRLSRLTEDHSVANQCRRAGIDLASRPDLAPHLDSLERALGSEERVDVDVHFIQPQAGDVLLLCSDGLTCAEDDRASESIVNGPPDPDIVAEPPVTRANRSGGPDNITAVLTRWCP